jgi:AraC-like DNA-binding protein
MFSALYFPLVTIQSMPSWPFATDRVVNLVQEGKLSAASQVMGGWIEDEKAGEYLPYALQSVADLQTVLGLEADAEETYHRSLHTLHASKTFSSKQELQITSCRNAAWRALFRYKLCTALACFTRMVALGKELGPARLFEARFGMACALYEMGRVDESLEVLDELEEQASALGARFSAWVELAKVVRFDISVQTEMHSANALRDHAYWRSGLEAVQTRDLHGTEDGRLSSTLLRNRVEYVRRLREMSQGVRDAASTLNTHLSWAQREGLNDYQRTLRLEIAAAALIGGTTQIAEAMLEPLHRDSKKEYSAHGRLDYLYYAAKTEQTRGHSEKAWQLYARYSLTAMQCLRENSRLEPFLDRATKLKAPADDIDARLPVRYRRGYRFMLDNLGRSDLSVCEIAAEIGVTERAVQWAFRKFLGQSPSELIRVLRMERIREDLLNTPTRDLFDVAKRWGVRSCSTLLDSYRKQFNEAPSKTMAPEK